MGCADEYGNSGNESLVLTTVIGTRYRVRIARYTGTGGTLSGTVCVLQAAPDECTNALAITQTSTSTLVRYSLGSTTQSVAPLLCTGYLSSTAYDVWFSFVATSTTPSITVVGSSYFDTVIDFRSGSCMMVINSALRIA